MVGKWLVVLPLLVDLSTVTLQPITGESNARQVRQLDLNECCPCPGRPGAGLRASDLGFTSSARDCPCENGSDPEAAASILLPALRAVEPFVKQTEPKTEPKPLLQPEVGLASSVLETLREVTDEEYQDALARDAARSVAKQIESDSSALDDSLTETPKNIVQIFLNQKDDMEDNLPQPSHIQETRCVHSPLESTHNGLLRMSRPAPVKEVFDAPRRPMKKPKKNKNLLHRNLHDMDSGVGASNIQERVVQPKTGNTLEDADINQTNKTYPTLFGLLSQNNKEKTDYNNGPAAKPKMNVKLREFFDNLESIKKEKTKLPALDLKQYFATTTRLPPFKFKPLENSLFRNTKPLQLKDLVKLKDVELIPPNNFPKNTGNAERPKPTLNGPNLKLQNANDDYDDDDDMNLASSINSDITTLRKPTNCEPTTPVISGIGTNIDSNPDNNKVLQNGDSFEDLEPDGSINVNKQTTLTEPDDLQTQNNSDIDSTESVEGSDAGDLLIQNVPLKNNKSSTECLSPDTDFVKHESNNNVFKTESEHNSNSNMDTSTEESNNNEYQIDSVEDTSLPIEFDDSSFTPEKDVDTKPFSNADEKIMSQEVLHDPLVEASDNNLRITELDDQRPTTTPESFSIDDSIPVENIAQVCKHSSEEDNENNEFEARNVDESPQPYDTNIGKEIQEKNNMEDSNSKDNYNQIAESKEDSSEINMQDLQVMSDSILNLSTTLSKEKNSLEESNLKEESHEIQNEDVEIHNDQLPESEIIAGNGKATLDNNSNQDLCISKTHDDNIVNTKTDSNSNEMLDATSNEMTAEASEPKMNSVTLTNYKIVEPKMSSLRNAVGDSTNDDVTKTTGSTNINDILQINKHSKFFDDLKLKLGNILSTTERTSKNKVLEDSVNESSNIKPRLSLIDELKSADKLQNKPQKLLKETLLPQFPGLLNSYKSKLPVPKSLDRTINLKPKLNDHSDTFSPLKSLRKDKLEKDKHKDLRLKKPQNLKKTAETPLDINFLPSLRSSGPNILKSPLDLSRPFEDVFDPQSALAAFSDRIRSHTEDSIQTLKDTLESRLRESQYSGLRLNSNNIDTQDILDSLTSKRDDLNDKFHAIHADINDRFSSFQRSVLDQLNLATSATNSEYAEESNNHGLRLTPLQSTLSDALKPRTMAFNDKQDSQNHFSQNLNIPEEKTTEKLFKSSKPKNLARPKSVLSKNADEKQPRLLEKNNLPSFNYKLPKIKVDDRKLPLHRTITLTTTEMPSLLPRPKSFKSRIPPKVVTETEEKRTLDKPLFRKPGRKSITMEEPEILPSHDSPVTRKISDKSFEISKEDETSTDSPLEKLRKTLLRRNQDMKARNNLKITSTKIKMPSSLVATENDDEKGDPKDTIMSRIKDKRTRTGLQRADDGLARKNDHKFNLQTMDDTEHAAAQEIEQVKLVEPLKENVPYKCKLICYKDM